MVDNIRERISSHNWNWSARYVRGVVAENVSSELDDVRATCWNVIECDILDYVMAVLRFDNDWSKDHYANWDLMSLIKADFTDVRAAFGRER